MPRIQPISIIAIESLSALGSGREEVWQAYLSNEHAIQQRMFNGEPTFVAQLPELYHEEAERFRITNSRYKRLDDTVIYALLVSRKIIAAANWGGERAIGVNLGSSRGATTLFETFHAGFISDKQTVPMASPSTTLGNISSWVAQDLQTTGPEISHSVTCSTALHALLNGIAWLSSGMADKFLVGGSEAPLTAFTIAQMKALKIYASDGNKYPGRALDMEKKSNTMILGEGAAIAGLERGINSRSLAVIEGVGYATELLEHSVSISAEADCFQRSMRMAMGDLSPADIDAIVLHAPGTLKGDQSEYRAVEKIFGTAMPLMTSNKWKLGHTLGASGMLSLEMAILMMQHQVFIPLPYQNKKPVEKPLGRILVNAVGFGGNAVSILLKHPDF